MKKILLLILALVANHVNCQISPTTAKADPAAVAAIKKQLIDIEAEQEKLVLSIKGAPKLIQQAKDLQQKWQSVKTPELIKQEQELRELQIKACVAEKTNPEITKIYARFTELYKIIEDLTKDEQMKIGVLRDVLIAEKVLDESATESQQREHQEKLTNVLEQIIKLDKQSAEKTPKQNNEISKLNERLDRLLYRKEIFELTKEIRKASKKPLADSEIFVKLRSEINQLMRPIEEKMSLLNKKYQDIFNKLPAEDQCALQYKPKNTDVYGGLILLYI